MKWRDESLNSSVLSSSSSQDYLPSVFLSTSPPSPFSRSFFLVSSRDTNRNINMINSSGHLADSLGRSRNEWKCFHFDSPSPRPSRLDAKTDESFSCLRYLLLLLYIHIPHPSFQPLKNSRENAWNRTVFSEREAVSPHSVRFLLLFDAFLSRAVHSRIKTN